jgi:hypothetical protein
VAAVVHTGHAAVVEPQNLLHHPPSQNFHNYNFIIITIIIIIQLSHIRLGALF